MANSSRRVNSTRSDYYRGQSYISGNTVRKLDEMPQRHEPGAKPEGTAVKSRQGSQCVDTEEPYRRQHR